MIGHKANFHKIFNATSQAVSSGTSNESSTAQAQHGSTGVGHVLARSDRWAMPTSALTRWAGLARHGPMIMKNRVRTQTGFISHISTGQRVEGHRIDLYQPYRIRIGAQ